MDSHRRQRLPGNDRPGRQRGEEAPRRRGTAAVRRNPDGITFSTNVKAVLTRSLDKSGDIVVVWMSYDRFATIRGKGADDDPLRDETTNLILKWDGSDWKVTTEAKYTAKVTGPRPTPQTASGRSRPDGGKSPVASQTAADGVDDVGDVEAGEEVQAEEAEEVHGEHLRCGGWRDGDVEDREPGAGAWVAFADGDLVGPPELGEGGGLAGAGGAADDAPACGDLLVAAGVWGGAVCRWCERRPRAGQGRVEGACAFMWCRRAVSWGWWVWSTTVGASLSRRARVTSAAASSTQLLSPDPE